MVMPQQEPLPNMLNHSDFPGEDNARKGEETSATFLMPIILQRKLLCINFVVHLPTELTVHNIKRHHRSAVVTVCCSRSNKAQFCYNIDQSTLRHIVKEKSLDQLNRFGGTQGIATYLRCDVHDGIDSEGVSWRREAFGANAYSHRAAKTPAINTLLAFVTIALGFDIKEHGLGEGIHDAASILIAVFLVISISVINEFRQNRKKIEVVRNGRRQQVPVSEIVAGEVVFLKIGDQIPADGLFLEGHSSSLLLVDESCLTGETIPVEINHIRNPFLHSGTKLVDGYYAKMLVTSVGVNTSWGEMQSSFQELSTTRKAITFLSYVVLGLSIARNYKLEKEKKQKLKEFAKVIIPSSSTLSSISCSISTNVFGMGKFMTKLLKVDQKETSSNSNSPLLSPPPKPLLIGTPSESGVFPVLLLIHGYLLYNSFYSQLVQHISSHGFIVVAPQLYSMAGADTTEEIKSTASITNWLSEGLQQFLPSNVKPNLRKLALAGHSRGGKVAFAVALGKAVTSLKFSALIGIDPVDGMEKGKQIPPILSYIPNSFNLDMAVSVIGSGLGELRRNSFFPPCAPKGVNHENFYNECRKPACYFVAKDYGHLDMLDDDTDGIRGKATYYLSTKGESRDPMRRFVGGIVVAFLRTYLEGNSRDLEAIRDGNVTSPVELQRVDFLV